MNELYCGYKDVPVTVQTMKGIVTTTVGMTYIKEDGRIMVFESWIKPFITEGLDAVDQTRILAEAFRQFAKAMQSQAPVYTSTGVKHE